MYSCAIGVSTNIIFQHNQAGRTKCWCGCQKSAFKALDNIYAVRSKAKIDYFFDGLSTFIDALSD
jgi:hypothetical protein